MPRFLGVITDSCPGPLPEPPATTPESVAGRQAGGPGAGGALSDYEVGELAWWLAEADRPVVAILDNAWAPGSSTPISRKDAEGNTYQVRTLASGEQQEVLKNFPTSAELAEAVRPVAREAHLESLTYYWLLVFTLK